MFNERSMTDEESDEIPWANATNDQTEIPWANAEDKTNICLLYTSPSPRDNKASRMPSSA